MTILEGCFSLDLALEFFPNSLDDSPGGGENDDFL